MTIEELTDEYNRQYNILCAKMDGISPLLSIYSGENLYLLRRRIKIYYDMATECKIIASILSEYSQEE